MKVSDVRNRVAKIKRQHCDESAHCAEDELYADVLRAIADGAPDAGKLARAALKTKDLNFSRWYA